MNKALQRFLQRLDSATKKRIFCARIIDANTSASSITTRAAPKLELYHSCQHTSNLHDSRIQTILRDGFSVGLGGTKGPGIYFSNHANYAFEWHAFVSRDNSDRADDSPVVMVCHIDPNVQYIQRFRSEIRTQNNKMASEYLVTNPALIKVKYLIKCQIDLISYHDDHRRHYNPWQSFGHFGCRKCDSISKRCDCPLTPIIDPNDMT
jgi:hypothetical protein